LSGFHSFDPKIERNEQNKRDKSDKKETQKLKTLLFSSFKINQLLALAFKIINVS